LGKNYNNGNFVFENNLYWDVTKEPFLFAGYDFADWQAEGYDGTSRVADPRFRNPEKGDFRLRRSSPVFDMGIEPLQDFSKIGLYGPRWWTRKTRKVIHRTVDPSMKKVRGGRKRQRNPRLIEENCETLDIDAKVPFAGSSGQEKGASIHVVANPAGEGKVVKFQDVEGLSHEWQPHLSTQLSWRRDAVHASFDVLMRPGAEFWHEWRDRSGPYKVGVNLRFKDGRLFSLDRDLCAAPVDKWVHIEISCGLGRQAEETFDLTVTVAGEQPRRFQALPFGNKEWDCLACLVWVSNATKKSEFYLDNLRYVRVKAPTAPK
ncbi:MAG: hypothetical protein KAI66_09310, partial [Lentisphaeria bacterium]|nr:hypothetical protein [Lentisphaeria bacterium]